MDEGKSYICILRATVKILQNFRTYGQNLLLLLFSFYYITCKDVNGAKMLKNFIRAVEGDRSNSYDYHNLYGLRAS